MAACGSTLTHPTERQERMNVLHKYDDPAFKPDEPRNTGDAAQSGHSAANHQLDVELANRAAAGDREAFTRIYHQHINRVYGLCLRLTADQVNKPINTTSVGRWKKDLNSEQIAAFESVALSTLTEMGYEVNCDAVVDA